MGQPVRDDTGKVVRLQGAQQDVTQRVRMLAEIRELNATLEERIAQRTRELERQQALFRTLAEQAPLPIWTIDPRGRATFLSPAWFDLVGGEPPRWSGMEWLEAMHPDDLPAVHANWRRCREHGTVFQGTRRIRARDGTFHTTTYRATPVRGEDGEIVFWVGMDADITDIMANEAALRLANEQLRAFSYSVSHDLQSPLQRIGSFTQLLAREIGPQPTGSRAEHYLNRIQANAEEMVQLVQGMLSLAEVSQSDMVRGRVDLTSMSTEILDRLQAESPERPVRCRVEPGLVVLGDVRLMRSVMENLLGNAWKFSAQQDDAEIVVGGSVARGEFFVRDNGAGFDMAHADKLFGTFQRLHRQDEFPGTGIGLATVARAIQRQGGAVHGEGQPGRGATFRFTMPVPATAAATATTA
jgi:PAS domain S-box-containing protein